MPLTNGFVAKWLLFDAALDANQAVVVVVAWAVSILTTFSFFKATVSVFYGMPSHELRAEEVHEAAPSMQVGLGITGALCVVFGFAPQLLMQPVIEPAVRSLGFDWQVQTTWLGSLDRLRDDRGNGRSGGGAGARGAVRRRCVSPRAGAGRRTPVAVFTGGDPLPEDDTLGAVDFAEMAEVAFEPVYSLDPDPLYLLIWREIKDVAIGARRFATAGLERRPVFTALVCAAALFAGVWLL